MTSARQTPGSLFEGRYRIVRQLGRGGFADVYLGTHIEIGQQVAIKILHKRAEEPRFVREGKVLASLKSPFTVRVIDFGRTAETRDPFLISEYIEGETLGDVIARGATPWESVVPIMKQVLESLAEAHAAGIVHRDVKPENIMLDAQGDAKVLDFGVARAESIGGTITGAGLVIGTPKYMAPEAILGQSVKPSIDVFAVGLTAYALLVGTEANLASGTDEILARQLSNDPYTLPKDVELPREIRNWVTQMCQKDPASRPPDAAVALAQLREAERAVAEVMAEADDHTQTEPTPRPATSASAVALIVVGLFAIALFAITLDASDQDTAPAPSAAPEVIAVVDPVAQADARGSTPDPRVAESFEKGRLLFDGGHWVAALREFHVVLSEPGSAEARVLEKRDYVRLATEELLDLPDSEQLRDDLRAVESMYPTDRRVRLRREALRAVDSLVVADDYPLTPEQADRIARTERLVDAGRFDAARDELGPVYAVAPKNRRVLRALGTVEFAAGRHSQALSWFRKAEAAGDRSPDLYLNLVEVLSKLGKEKQMVKRLHQFLEVEPVGVRAQEVTQLLDARKPGEKPAGSTDESPKTVYMFDHDGKAIPLSSDRKKSAPAR